MKRFLWGLAPGLGLGLMVVALGLLAAPTRIVRAHPDIRYVAPDGNDGRMCDSVANRCRTIQWAIDVANPDDEIRVAAGTYSSAEGTAANIIKPVKLLGGWNQTFTVREPGLYPTILNARRLGRVLEINSDSEAISVWVDGFTITGGNATDEPQGKGRGGGIYGRNADLIIQNNIITNNVAAINPTTGYGGGIYLERAAASSVISGNQVLSNTAGTGSWDSGGGLYLTQCDATIVNNLIQGNSSSYYGGGAYIFLNSAHLLNNEFKSNTAGRNGAGVYLNGVSALIQGNLILGNIAGGGAGASYGGGLMLDHGQPTVTGNRIVGNAAGNNAGLGLATSDYFTVTNNFIAHNGSGGIRLWENTRYGLIAHNTIAFNGGEGGIRLVRDYITPTIVNNIIVSNTYGITATVRAAGRLDYNDVWGNVILDYDLPGALEPGPHDIQADPLFTNAAGNDYHLRPGSPCLNAGTNAGITTDIDGDPRPIGPHPDIGADEYRPRYLYLPMVTRSYP